MSSSHRPGDSFGPSQTVAVIGAGISGVCAAAHLLKQRLSVTVLERSSTPGGIWHYDERVSEDPPFPSTKPSHGDYEVSQSGEFAYATPPPESHRDVTEDGACRGPDGKVISDLEVHFSPPGPCYGGLKNNVPTYLMQSSLASWPEGTGAFVTQKEVEKYVQSLANQHGVTAITHFNTRVDEVRKTADGSRWEVRTVALERGTAGTRLVERHSQFDLVVVASGHYNMPRVPDIEGLKEWKAAFPNRIIHSKQYRNPEKYRDQNVVILGAGVSSSDICRELSGVGKQTYQSVRGGQYDLPVTMLPDNAKRVPEITRFVLGETATQKALEGKDPIPGRIILKDGAVLKDIHQVVVATGYITSYPFLSQLHSDEADVTEAGENIVVTSDGNMAHNLHKDIFYISDPTLAFIGVPYHVATFSLFDFQAQVLARVFSGKSRLPPQEEMRKEYTARVKRKGLGRAFHSLHAEDHEVEYVNELVAWVNEGVLQGVEGDLMQGHTEEWLEGYNELKEEMRDLFSGGAKDGHAQVDEAVVAAA
ncbi:hypothetical protein QBC35DRAFT_509864 [Podospora australis]|uniref:Monooxygenase n=1 Tax=Podospora australis TaxID=1536484 RepID=A0AAN6WI36_9PEZI|nr:hypothetical protein QBC35DRAFT_509864 [Podospora australis]